jgi:hypothetical protein
MIEQPHIIPIRLPDFREGYRLAHDFVYEWEAENALWKIFIPAGFEYDGASVPRFLWTLLGISPDGLHRAAALVHDWLYRHAGLLPDGSFWKDGHQVNSFPWQREQVDKLFANMLAEYGVGKFRRRSMYLGVRAGGWRAWNGHAKQQLNDLELFQFP